MDTHDGRGWVKPVDDTAGPAFMDPIEPTGRTIRSSVIGGIILVAVIAVAVAGTVMWRGRNGDPFASARSVPADMDFVVTFDALALSDSDRLQALVDAFAVPMVEAEMIEDYPDDLVVAIDEAMADVNGLTLTDDVIPWIGRSVSIAGTVPRFDDPFDYQPEFSFLVSADVRDTPAAERFVATVLSELAANDVAVTAAEIGGFAGHRIAVGYDEPEAAMVLTGDSLLLGTEGDVAAAIAAHDAGLSIADDALFKSTMAELPSDRMFSVYVAPTAFTGVTDLASLAAPGAEVATEEAPFTAGAAAVSLIDEGLLFSYAAVGAEEAIFSPDEAVLAGLPAGTLGFFSITAPGGAASLDEEAMADLGYPLEELSYQFGVDVVALIGSISGDLTLAATETRNSSIAAQSDVPIGIVGVLGLNDSGPASEVIEMLEELLRENSGGLTQEDGVTTLSVEGQEILSYSLNDEMLVLGTGPELVADVGAGTGGGLLASELYLELDSVVAGDGLVFYADIGRIVGIVPTTTEEAAVFAPMRGVGFGGEVRGDTIVMEALLLIDY